VINYPAPGGALREHAVVIGRDGSLYNYWNGVNWYWTDLGTPP